MLIVYTGDGKGKTTAAVGLAVRAAGAGKSVTFIKFMKGFESSEDRMLESIGVNLVRTGMKRFVVPGKATPDDIREAEKGLSHFSSCDDDVIICDELNVAMMFGLLDEGRVRNEILRKKGSHVVLVTGRGAPEWLLEMANIVTEMKEVKHWFNDGRAAIKGVDY